MKDLTIWKDEQFREMREELDRLFRDFLGDFAEPRVILPRGEAELPRVELSEEDEVVLIRMAFPGLDPADLSIEVSPEAVIITADRQERLSREVGELHHRFSQRITLPCRVEPERAEALCFDHRLEIRLPKSRATAFRNISLRRVKK